MDGAAQRQPNLAGRQLDIGFREGGEHETFRQYVERATRELEDRQRVNAPGIPHYVTPSLLAPLANLAARRIQLQSAAARSAPTPTVPIRKVTDGEDLVKRIKKTAVGLRQRLPRPRKTVKGAKGKKKVTKKKKDESK